MVTWYLNRFSHARSVILPTSTVTDEPTATSGRFSSKGYERATTYVAVTGTVDATVRLWIWNGDDWFKGASVEVSDADGNVAIDWDIGNEREFTFTIEAIAGGGTVAVSVEGS